MTNNDANSFLMGGGITSAKFPSTGTTVAGRIVRISDPQQQRDFATGAPKVWDDGNPMMQLPIELATDLRDPDVDDDDGARMLYVKGALQKSVREAIRASGAKGLEVGGTLSVTYARDGVPKQKGFNAPKEYEVTYSAPTGTANEFLGVDKDTGEIPAAATAGQDPVATARSLLALGTPASQVAAATGLDMAVVAALANLSSV